MNKATLRKTFRLLSACAAACAVVTIVACEAPTATRPAAAFDITALTDGHHYRWANGSHVRVAIATTNLPATTLLDAAVRRAIAEWNAVPQFGEVTLELVSRLGDANIIIFDQVTPIPVQPAACLFDPRGAAGYTYFCPTYLAQSKAFTASDSALRMNLVSGAAGVTVVIRVDRGRVATNDAYNAIVAHEFGHAMGIGGHSLRATDVMYGSPTASVPTEVDKAALRSAFGFLADIRL